MEETKVGSEGKFGCGWKKGNKGRHLFSSLAVGFLMNTGEEKRGKKLVTVRKLTYQTFSNAENVGQFEYAIHFDPICC